MDNGREQLQAERDRLSAVYNRHVIDWNDPETLRESARLYNDCDKVARRLDLH